MNAKQVAKLRQDAQAAIARLEILAIIDSAEGEAVSLVEMRQIMACLARGTPHRQWFADRGNRITSGA